MSLKNKTAEKATEVFVAGHICLDLVPGFDARADLDLKDIFVPGKLTHIGQSVLSSGGTVSNTGLALRQLGFATGLMAKVGDDFFGQGLMNILKDFRSGLKLIVDPESTTSYTYVIAPPGVDRVFLHHPGANDTFTGEELDYGAIAKARLFHFGYPPLMRKMYENDGNDMALMFKKVKETGVTSSLDMAYPDPESDAGKVDWKLILLNTLPHVDVFLPSVEEILFMLDRDKFFEINNRAQASGESFIELFDMADLPGLADEILEMGSAVAVIKMGHKGLYMKTASSSRLAQGGKALADLEGWSDQSLFAPSFFVEKILSTTGAGDSAIAGILSAILTGDSPRNALRLACGAAAQKIQVRQSFGGIDPLEILKNKLDSWELGEVNNVPSSWTFETDGGIWEA